MKLFKKLAAVTLAAVLALSMVGCGSSNALKDELVKVAMDQVTVGGGTATHSKKMDDLAAKLIEEANKAAAQEVHKDDDVDDLLTDDDVVAAAGINVDKEGYIVNVVENIQFKSSGSIFEMQKLEWMMEAANPRYGEAIGKFTSTNDLSDDVDIGAAIGKIGSKEYIVLLQTNHAA